LAELNQEYHKINDMGKSFNDSAITRILLSHRFADGGSMDSDKSDRPISQQRRDVRGVTEFNAGGSHEENPYGGVPQGIAPDGAPNLVEQGEVKLSDIIGQDNQYVLSNRIMIDAEHARQFNIPDSVVGMTYAAAFKKLYQPLKERNGNIEVKNEIAHLANAFMQAQDSIKAEQEAQQASAIMQALPPEAQQRMIQAAMGQQQGGQPSPQDQQAMQQQQMMAQQQMPPEAMMQQGGQLSPEEIAMMQQQMAAQQQDPNAIAAQQPMMARGGKLYNQFSKGGNMKFNNNMFGGVFAHRFDEGGNIQSQENDSPQVLDVSKGSDGRFVATLQDGDHEIDVDLSTILASLRQNKDRRMLKILQDATKMIREKNATSRAPAPLDSAAIAAKRDSAFNADLNLAMQIAQDKERAKMAEKEKPLTEAELMTQDWERLDDILEGQDKSKYSRLKDNGTWSEITKFKKESNNPDLASLSYKNLDDWAKKNNLFLSDEYDGLRAAIGGGYGRAANEYMNKMDPDYKDPRESKYPKSLEKAFMDGSLQRELSQNATSEENQETASVASAEPTVKPTAEPTMDDINAALGRENQKSQSRTQRQGEIKDTNGHSSQNTKSSGQSKKQASKNTEKQQNNAPHPTEDKSIEELANMVIRGKFGNGKARKEALGDKYAAVQKLVNEKMAASKAKKAKVKDERGGTKEVEIPSWVGKPDDLDKPIESKAPQVDTSDLGLSNLSPKGLRSPYQNEEYPFLEDESEFDRLLRRMHRQTAGL
jgi:hypothetical protein